MSAAAARPNSTSSSLPRRPYMNIGLAELMLVGIFVVLLIAAISDNVNL